MGWPKKTKTFHFPVGNVMNTRTTLAYITLDLQIECINGVLLLNKPH